MKSLERFLDIVDRCFRGPIVHEQEFDMQRVSAGVARVLKAYDVRFKDEHFIQRDDALLDRLYQAALDFAQHCGVYNTSTKRLLTFSPEELEGAIKRAPSKLTVGDGEGARAFRTRLVEDATPPSVSGGPIGTPLSEDLYVPILRSYWQEPLLDVIVPGTLSTTYGREVRARTPLEIAASWQEVALTDRAAALSGRSGISRMCVEMSISDVGHLSAISRGGFKPSDTHLVNMISEMKTNNELLNRVAHTIHQGGLLLGFYNPILGGLGGGAEGVAVLIVAGFLAMLVLYQTHSVESCPTHPFNSNSTDPRILRAVSAACGALARNTDLLTEFMTSPVSGPGTESLFYECAAMATTISVCGASRVLGVRSAVGVVENHCSGLEARFNGEVARAAAGMSRAEAEDIVRRAVAQYEEVLSQRPVGKPFAAVYDVETIQPTAEWLETYEKVKQEIRGWGLPLP